MYSPEPSRVNRRVVCAVVLLAACVQAPSAERPDPGRRRGELGLAPEVARTAEASGPRNGIDVPRLLGDRPLGGHLGDLSPLARHPLGETWTPLQDLGAHLTDAAPGGGGEALEAAIDELSNARRRQGAAGLTLSQLMGDTFHPGLCEDAAVELPLSLDGERWEASLSVPSFMAFVNDPAAYTSEIPDTCVDALAAHPGDVAAAEGDGCVEDDLQQFLPEGSACRVCVEGNGGDYAACVEADSCVDEAPQVVWVEEDGQPVWYQMATAEMWACAPDETVLTILLADIPPSGELPRAFDHAAWAYLCLPYWDEAENGVSYTCISGEGGPRKGDALLEGMVGRVNWMHPPEDDGVDHHANLQYWVDSIELQNAAKIRWFWGFSTGAGVFSMPSDEPDSNGNGVYDIADENYGYPLGGWGIDPYALRPDGTDPDNVDDTFARDWVGTMAIKFSTTRDGVPISVADHSRCLAWSEPGDDGVRRCVEQGPPVYGWQNDVQNTWWDSSFTQAYPFPVATLGSTGLPDPKIPGGVVTLVAGTPALADPDWDACTWPDSFVPDRAPMEDTPANYGGPASLWADTWDFDKRGDLDLRAVLYSNQARDFCPEDTE